MSTRLIIVCPDCRSYRVDRLPLYARWPTRFLRAAGAWLKVDQFGKMGDSGPYVCWACGCEFYVRDPKKYCQRNPFDRHRCLKCDQKAVELVEHNHRYPGQPREEIVDLYRCTACGQEILSLIQESPEVLYG